MKVRNNGVPKLAREQDGIIYTGRPNCPKCGGKGIVNVPDSPILEVRPCECTLVQDLLTNLERGWKGLRFAENIQGTSPLLEMAKSGESCWITADNDVLRSHLKHVALRMSSKWHFSVSSDADLLSAWLASVPLSGLRVMDPEIAMRLSEHAPVSMNKLTLIDLVLPPDLMIVILGVKAARNNAMPEVFHEAMTTRIHEGKPIWVVDQSFRPFAEAHRAYSMEARMEMRDFNRIHLEETASTSPTVSRPKNVQQNKPKTSLPSVSDLPGISSAPSRNRLRFSNGSGGTKAMPTPEPQPKTPPRKKGWKR